MKAFLSIILIFLLPGCVVFPQAFNGSGKNLHYGKGATEHRSSYYASSAYYPWWSMDYFYLGAGFGYPWYDYYYSPYFYPHYFSVWYPSRYWGPGYGYGRYATWQDPYWYNRYQDYERVAYPPTYRMQRPGFGPVDTLGQASRVRNGEPLEDTPSASRRASFGSAGASGASSMTVISPSEGKAKPSGTRPVMRTGVSASVASPGAGASAPATSSPSLTTPRPSAPHSPSMRSNPMPSSAASRSSRSSSFEHRRSSAPSRTRDRDRD